MVKLIKKDKKNKGFTLIELVAVVAIIGILAALLVPKIAEYIQDAKKTKIIDQARKVVMAVDTVNTKNDVQIDYSTTVKNAFAGTPTASSGTITQKIKDEIKAYLGGTQADIAPNLIDGMTITQCKGVTEGTLSFKVDDSGKFATA